MLKRGINKIILIFILILLAVVVGGCSEKIIIQRDYQVPEELQQIEADYVLCGNGIIEEGEDYDTCCIDAGCPSSMFCENNICKEPIKIDNQNPSPRDVVNIPRELFVDFSCKSNTQSSNENIVNLPSCTSNGYPKSFLDEGNKITLVLGSNGGAYTTLVALNLQSELENSGWIVKQKLDTEVDGSEKNLILFDNPCQNSLVKLYAGSKISCNPTNDGLGHISFLNKNGKNILIIWGDYSVHYQQIVKVISQGSCLEVGETCITGLGGEGRIVSCSDSTSVQSINLDLLIFSIVPLREQPLNADYQSYCQIEDWFKGEISKWTTTIDANIIVTVKGPYSINKDRNFFDTTDSEKVINELESFASNYANLDDYDLVQFVVQTKELLTGTIGGIRAGDSGRKYSLLHLDEYNLQYSYRMITSTIHEVTHLLGTTDRYSIKTGYGLCNYPKDDTCITCGKFANFPPNKLMICEEEAKMMGLI